MFTRSNNKKNGFTLIVLLVAIVIIAAIFGGFYFSKNKAAINTPQGQIEALKKSEADISDINAELEENNKKLKEEIDNIK